MNLSAYDTRERQDDGVWADIFDPGGYEVVMQVKVAGRDSKIIKRRQQELAKKRQNKRKITPAEEEQDALETVCHATLSWRMMNEETGDPEKEEVVLDGDDKYPCTFDNVKTIYTKYPFIAEQIIDVIASRERFLEK